MCEHTPGPWMIQYVHGVPLGVGKRTNSRGHCVSVCEMICNTLAETDEERDQGVLYANARLIAAAPETKRQRDALLKAAKLALIGAGAEGWDAYPAQSESPGFREFYEALKSAVADAEMHTTPKGRIILTKEETEKMDFPFESEPEL